MAEIPRTELPHARHGRPWGLSTGDRFEDRRVLTEDAAGLSGPDPLVALCATNSPSAESDQGQCCESMCDWHDQARLSTTLNIYTHVVEASHRKAVEAVEERLFGELDCSGLKLSTAVDQPQPASAVVH